MTRFSGAHRALTLAVIFGLQACAGSGLDGDGGESPGDGLSASELVGELEVYVIHFDDDSSETFYELVTDGGQRWELVFGADAPLATGDRVSVTGRSMGDDRFAVTSYRSLEEDDEVGQSALPLTGNSVQRRSRLAVLMVHWGSPDGMTQATLRQRVFGASTSTREFYTENSSGLVDLTGDVFGWYRVPAMTNCDTRTLATNARQAASNAGVAISQYNQILYYFPKSSQCRWSGLAFVGRPTAPARDSWYNGSSGCVVLGHEVLHNFGAMHARAYSCGSSAMGSASQCSYSEYGDPYDAMGGGCYHFSTYNKAAQGWLGGCNAVTATANGTFDLVPASQASNATQSLRIPMSGSLCPTGLGSCFYYLEYRQPLGAFESQNPNALVHRGVSIRVGSGVDFSGGGRPTYSYLIDTTPGSASGFRDAPLTAGRTFQDPAGVRVTVDALSSQSARVSVSFPNGGSGAATCIDGRVVGGTPTPEPPPVSTCAAGQTAYQGHCYALTSSTTTYDGARTACQALGAGWGLAEIGSAAENQFVSGLTGSVERWLGGNDRAVEGEWRWQSGAQFWTGGLAGRPVQGAYANFITGEPNDAGNSDCLRMIAGGGWRDIQCGSRYRAVCESR